MIAQAGRFYICKQHRVLRCVIECVKDVDGNPLKGVEYDTYEYCLERTSVYISLPGSEMIVEYRTLKELLDENPEYDV